MNLKGIKLIDANDLQNKFKIRKTMVGRLSDCDCLLEDAPTVEAIPIEWLNGLCKFYRFSSSTRLNAIGNVIEMLIREWRSFNNEAS